jgi:hypothetical protein
MARIILTAEGQEFDLEDEVARDDELLRQWVKSVAPAYANPTFKRDTKAEVLTVSVSKQAGTKGYIALDVLDAAPEDRGPVAALRARMDSLAVRRRLTVRRAAEMEPEVLAAVETSEQYGKAVRLALDLLDDSGGVPASYVPEGF